MLEKSIESNNIETTDISEINNQKNYQKVVHVNVAGEFASAIIKGVELSKGQFILAVDADVDYPEEVISELIKNLMNSPNSIIIASRYAKGVAKQRLPSIRSTISKGARIIVRHGLNVKDVRDPLSGCFAFPRQVIEDMRIEDSKGNGVFNFILVLVCGNELLSKHLT